MSAVTAPVLLSQCDSPRLKALDPDAPSLCDDARALGLCATRLHSHLCRSQPLFFPSHRNARVVECAGPLRVTYGTDDALERAAQTASETAADLDAQIAFVFLFLSLHVFGVMMPCF